MRVRECVLLPMRMCTGARRKRIDRDRDRERERQTDREREREKESGEKRCKDVLSSQGEYTPKQGYSLRERCEYVRSRIEAGLQGLFQ